MQQGHPAHHAEECQQREDKEILHRCSVVFGLVGILRLRKDDGLVGIAECLGNHCHNHRYLHARAVVAQQHVGLCLVGIDQREDNLIGHLVQNTCNTQYQDGPRVAEHLLQQCTIELPLNLEQVRNEEQRDETRTQQVDEEDVEHRRLAQHDEVEHVQSDVQHDEQHLQRCKADGALLETQEAERDSLQGVEGYHHAHHQQELRVFAIS